MYFTGGSWVCKLYWLSGCDYNLSYLITDEQLFEYCLCRLQISTGKFCCHKLFFWAAAFHLPQSHLQNSVSVGTALSPLLPQSRHPHIPRLFHLILAGVAFAHTLLPPRAAQFSPFSKQDLARKQNNQYDTHWHSLEACVLISFHWYVTVNSCV